MVQDDNNGVFSPSNSWCLPSSDGWNKVTGTLVRRWITPKGENCFVTDVSITGDFWQRDKKNVSHAKMTRDFVVNLPQILINTEYLRKLRDELNQWLSHPQEIAIELSSSNYYPLLQIEFGIRSDVICKPEKPVCTVQYIGERMRGEWYFVVDQSCMWLLRDDLNQVLKN